MVPNGSNPQATAFLRGLWIFFFAAVPGAITVYLSMANLLSPDQRDLVGVSTSDMLIYSVLSGLLAGFGALGYRSVAEGRADASRDAAGNVLPGDVTPNKPVV